MTKLQIKTAEVFEPFLKPSRYKAAFGGRGSAKSHFFAELLVEHCILNPGTRAVCVREVQQSLKESAKKLLEDKIQSLNAKGFKTFHDRIAAPGDGVIIFQGMKDHTADSIKSLENFTVCWVEEAQSLSETSLRLLRPTIRAENSELWFSWNPRFKNDPVDILFRQQKPPSNSIVVKSNWNNNPWFPDTLEQERIDSFNNEPEQYNHVWEGDYVTAASGAYFTKHINKARQENRITTVPEDEMMVVRLFIDIGGTGAKADNFVIWCAQFIGLKIHVIDHYEVQGQPFAAHLNWLRSKGYTPDRCKVWLPHDGSHGDKVIDISYESAFKKAGYSVEVVPNQGKGAAMKRVEAVRNIFKSIWIDKDKCQAGLDALGWYHERKDQHRNVGLGPEHDWSSHSSDSFGLMCTVYEPPKAKRQLKQPKLGMI